jgi:hypothetical protein
MNTPHLPPCDQHPHEGCICQCEVCDLALDNRTPPSPPVVRMVDHPYDIPDSMVGLNIPDPDPIGCPYCGAPMTGAEEWFNICSSCEKEFDSQED